MNSPPSAPGKPEPDPVVVDAPLAGWLTELGELPDPAFADRIVGDGIAIDPTEGAVYAPCDGMVSVVAATGHAVTLELDCGATLLLHVGLDTVALGGQGFGPCVVQGMRVSRGDLLLRFDLDLVVRQAASALTPVLLLHDDGFAIERCRPDGAVAPGQAVFRIVPVSPAGWGSPEPSHAAAEWHERAIVVPLAHGIHARPAARLRDAARRFDAEVVVRAGCGDAGLRSPAGLLSLGVRHGETVVLRASGREAVAALDAIAALIESGMGEHRPVARDPASDARLPAAPEPAQAPPREPVDGRIPGVTAVSGLAAGPVCRADKQDIAFDEPGGDPLYEAQRLDAALDLLRARLAADLEHAGDMAEAIFAAHLAMLDDEDLVASAHRLIAAGAGAGRAWHDAIGPLAERLGTSSDPRMVERAADLRDLDRRVQLRLAGREEAPGLGIPGGILLADDLLPSQMVGLEPGALAGICLARGGPTSHVAILAAGLGIPMLVAAGPAIERIAEGDEVVLDAAGGMLEYRPDAARLAEVRDAIARGEVRRAAARAMTGPCQTRDGTRIEVFANLGSLGDARPALANGAEGCGLLRSEFLFLDRDTAPDLAEQAAVYQAIADALAPRPLIVRLLDLGGDKPAPYLPIAPEENPMLGLRGVRVGLAHRAMLQTQIDAILAVRPLVQCRIMVPMVADIAELAEVRAMVDDARARLAIAEPVELGIMVETPAAAVTADLLAREADFLSIGTNDLTQYVMAMDRGNAAVAAGIDGLHPAVLRLIDATCRGAAKHGRWTGVCGGLASDPLAVPLLVGLGVTELSAAPAQVAEIKAVVAGLSHAAARELALRALTMSSAAEVRAAAREFV